MPTSCTTRTHIERLLKLPSGQGPPLSTLAECTILPSFLWKLPALLLRTRDIEVINFPSTAMSHAWSLATLLEGTSLSCETPAKGSEVAYCWSNRSSLATSGSFRKHFDGACFKWGFNFQLLNHQQQQQQQQVPFGKWLNESYVELKFARLKLSNSIYPPSPFLFDFPQGFSSPVWFRKTENKLNLSSSLSLSLSLSCYLKVN